MTVTRNEMTAFDGGVAVITGAGSGIGEGLARHAALNLGMTVVLADVDEKAIQGLAQELASSGAAALAVPTDVSDFASVERLAEKSYAVSGDVRVLINNAGVEQFGYLWDTPVTNWDRLVSINVSGVFYGIRAFLPRMLARGEGPSPYVLNLSSVGGVGAAPLQAPYIMSKHSVLSLTECLYLEVEHAGADIHVCAVLPGIVASNIFQSAGGVEDGDVSAAEDQRAAMMKVRQQGITPLEAAATIFQQAAAGEFYILTHPEMIQAAMNRRADQLRERRAPTRRVG